VIYNQIACRRDTRKSERKHGAKNGLAISSQGKLAPSVPDKSGNFAIYRTVDVLIERFFE